MKNVHTAKVEEVESSIFPYGTEYRIVLLSGIFTFSAIQRCFKQSVENFVETHFFIQIICMRTRHAVSLHCYIQIFVCYAGRRGRRPLQFYIQNCVCYAGRRGRRPLQICKLNFALVSDVLDDVVNKTAEV